MVLGQTPSSTSTDSTSHSDESSTGKRSLPGGFEARSPAQGGTHSLVGWISKTLSLPTLTNMTDQDQDQDQDQDALAPPGDLGQSAGREHDDDDTLRPASPVGTANRQREHAAGVATLPPRIAVQTATPNLSASTGSIANASGNGSRFSIPGSFQHSNDSSPAGTPTGARTVTPTPRPAPLAAAPPPATTSSSLLSFLPSLPTFNLNLHSFVPRIPTTLGLNFSPFDSDDNSSSRTPSGGKPSDKFRVSETVGGGVGEASELGDGASPLRRMSMDLQIDQALANGETFEDRAPDTNGGQPSPQQPAFSPLTRRESSAFVAASGSGRVNPLTLQAIARKGSENDALRVDRERQERERRWTDEDAEASGMPSRPNLARDSSWNKVAAAASSLSGRGDSSPTGSGRRASIFGSATDSAARREREISQASSLGSATRARELRQEASKASLASHMSSPTASPSKPSLTATPNRPLSAVPNDKPVVRKTSLFGRFSRPKTNSKFARTDLIDQADTAAPVAVGSPAPSENFAGKLDKGKEKEKIRYVKVKSKGKSTKDFGKLFLAQELFISAPSSPLSNGSTLYANGQDDHSIHSGTSPDDASMHSSPDPAPRKKNAVWAIKFSADGKYLAVGGKDGIVRVWEVLGSPEPRHSAMHPDPVDVDRSLHGRDSSLQTPQTASSSRPAESKKKSGNQRVPVATMPVFGSHPIQEWRGHEADVLDLSWSKNNFLLSSSMDKTVRLWHVSRAECLCAFQHLDFVTSIAFHPKDDRFFLSGSLDCKLRLWNIPEKRVHVWTELPELITSVAFSSDGKLAIAGSFVGVCMFFEVNTFHYHAQFAAKSSRGKNSKGRKITSMVSMPIPSSGGERLLVTSNDSRMRLYHLNDKHVEMKYMGHENTSSQIRASFSDDAHFIISGSEDRHVYIWDSGLTPKEDGGLSFFKKKEGAGYECFQMAANIITCATFAPSETREVLAHSEDPIFSVGNMHLAPLRETLSGAPLSAFPTGTSARFLPATSGDSLLSAAEDSIIVVADDTTGVISIFRNSVVPRELDSGSKARRRGSRVPSEA